MKSIARWAFMMLGICAAGLLCASAPALATKQYVPGVPASFGESGSGPGQFTGPSGIAVEEASLTQSGDVYVVDKGDNRVEWFTADGAPAGEFTGATTPAKAFSNPEAIAIDNSTDLSDPSRGDVYVVDTGHSVVDKFSPEGIYLGQITTGEGGEPFGKILGVAVDPKGQVWVLQENRAIDGYTDSEVNTLFTTREPEFRAFQNGPGFAVDAEGNFYSNSGQSELAKYNGEGRYLIFPMAVEAGETASSVAVDDATNEAYLAADAGGAWSVTRYNTAPSCTVVQPCEVAPKSALTERFGTSKIGEASAVAVNSATNTVYVSDAASDTVHIFTLVTLPNVTTAAASDAQIESATLNGAVNPEGEPLTECKFEYGASESYGQEAPCENIPAGSEEKPVSAKIAGLNPRTTYHYRLIATNKNGTTDGKDGTLFTVTAPLVEHEASLNVSATEASLSATLDAAGLASTYRVEYGTTPAYGSSTKEVSLGASQAPVNAPTHLPESGRAALLPGTTYYFRFAVTNALGTTYGKEGRSFTTPAAGTGVAGTSSCPNRLLKGFSPSLPDCRAYELVSEELPGEVYVPANGFIASREQDVRTLLPMRASSEGEGVAFVGEAGDTGGTGAVGNGLGNEFVGHRDPDGRWSDETATPQAAVAAESSAPEFSAFSSDLAIGVFSAEPAVATYLSTIATPGAPFGCTGVYSRDGGGYHALFTSTKQPGSCGEPYSGGVFSRQNLLFAGGNEGTAGVAPFQSLLLQSPAALAPESEVAQEGLEGDNLYDSVDGHTYAVNVLPDGQLAEDAVLGGPAGEAHQRPDFDRVIAADGSRVFWTDLDTTVGPENPGGLTRLFAREDPTSSSATTVQVDALQSGPGNPGGGRFWTASADGTKVLFTDESKLTTDATAEPGMPNLYLYDFDKPLGSRLTDLTPAAGAAVQGVVGASSSGAYVYFVADGALAKNHNSEGAGAEPRTCEEAAGNLEPGTPSEEEALGHLPHGIGCNLYVWHEGDTEPTFIAALARKDDNLMVNRGAPIVATGDWQPELGSRTAQVTPNGGALVFESTQQLTGYDNSALVEDATHATTGLSNDIAKLAVEIFAYDAVSGPEGKLSCASCAPTGEPPAQEAHGAEAGTFLPTTENPTYMRRWISEDGSRVFFDSSQPLSSADSNHLQDVYEWERPAETGEADNGCTAQAVSPITGGCTSLLSGGQSSDSSFLIDADASGNNVFFAHRGQLAGIGASEGKMDVIDARVGGGFAESSEACTGTGCQGVPPGPPTFATPSTATFAGPGNFPPLTTVKKTTVKKTVKCKKGYVKNKKNKCVKKPKKKKKNAKKASNNRRGK